MKNEKQSYFVSVFLKTTKLIFRFLLRFKTKYWRFKFKLRNLYYTNVLLGGCGKHIRVYDKATIYRPHMVYVGDNFTINDFAQISPRGNVYIGNNVTMSRGSQITSGMYDLRNWNLVRLIGGVKHVAKDVYIGDGTWLCVNSIVLPGVKITGKGVVVAAGAVVVNDIKEDYVIVGGIPAKIIKYIGKETS